jgi:hypothetical protein
MRADSVERELAIMVNDALLDRVLRSIIWLLAQELSGGREGEVHLLTYRGCSCGAGSSAGN